MSTYRSSRRLNVVPMIEEFEPRLVPNNGVPTPAHVVIVIEENHNYNQIIGSSSAPYINSLAAEGAVMSNSHGIGHPSQPNYLELFSGSNQGITNDNCCPMFTNVANLGAELIAAGDTFGGYSESMPSVGFTGSSAGGSNGYFRKHNPWVDFNNVPTADNMPFQGYFPTNFAQLPTLSIVVPNEEDDMHNGTIQQGDTWLQTNMNAYIQWAKTNNSVFVLTFDEGSLGDHIPTLFVGQNVKTGKFTENINHYNMLRTFEDMYGLTYAGSSATATPITNIWITPRASISGVLSTSSLVSLPQVSTHAAQSDASVIDPSAARLDALFLLYDGSTGGHTRTDTSGAGRGLAHLSFGGSSAVQDALFQKLFAD